MDFSDRVIAAREHAKITQDALAKAVGVSQQAIQKLESGKAKASRNSIRIAVVCGVRPEWLADDSGPMLQPIPTQSQPARLSGSIILAAYREAVAKFEHATGLNETSFQPFEDEDDAALLASCIEGQLSADGGITGQGVNKDGSAGSNRVGSGIAGKDRAPEAGGESAPAHRQRKKSAA